MSAVLTSRQRDLRDILARAVHAVSGMEPSPDNRHGHEWLSAACLIKNYGESCADQTYEYATELMPVVSIEVNTWIDSQLAEAERRGAVKALRAYGRDCQGMTEIHPEAAVVWLNYANAIEAEALRIEAGGEF